MGGRVFVEEYLRDLRRDRFAPRAILTYGRRLAADFPRDTIVSVKRFMGRSSADPETRRLSPYKFAEGASGVADGEIDIDGSARRDPADHLAGARIADVDRLPGPGFPPHTADPDRGPDPVAGSAAGFTGPPGRRIHLGDIVVSVDRAIAQARAGRGGQTGDARWSPADELRLLVTHGALHLCGWDHADAAEEREMRALERRLLAGS